MKQSSKCALGGVVAALSLSLMISASVAPFLTYALPAIAGALVVFIVIEIDKKWAFGVYCVVAALGTALIPDKETAAIYLAFFGYYPILKAIIENKTPIVVGWVLKILTFVCAMSVSYYLMIRFMGVTLDETEEFGKAAVPILLGMGSAAFVIYDVALTKLATLYVLRWRKYFKRYFK